MYGLLCYRVPFCPSRLRSRARFRAPRGRAGVMAAAVVEATSRVEATSAADSVAGATFRPAQVADISAAEPRSARGITLAASRAAWEWGAVDSRAQDGSAPAARTSAEELVGDSPTGVVAFGDGVEVDGFGSEGRGG